MNPLATATCTRKVVFLDIDGTYLDRSGRVPDSARQAVVRARANGHLVFLCTGRATPMIWDSITEAGFDGVIASAGGYIELAGEVLQHRTVAVADVEHVVGFFDAHDIGFLLESTSGIYASRSFVPHLIQRVTGWDQTSLQPFLDTLVVGADLLRSDINKVSFLNSALTIDDVRAEFATTFDVIPGSVPDLGRTSGEMAIPGVNKAQGIAVLLARLGLAREDTIAFGDNFNDMEMLRYAGVGVAMGNAPLEVQAMADTLTGSPDEDGILHGFAALGLV